MGITNSIKKLRVPTLQEVSSIPKRASVARLNTEKSHVKIRFFDRFFKKCIVVDGIKEYKTSIPIIYFETPNQLAVIVFDDSEYLDEHGQVWIDVCEDYPYALNYNTELTRELTAQYYNDFAENKLPTIENGKEGYQQYKIPVLLNRIPREVICVDPYATQRHDTKYISNKIEMTLYLLRQIGRTKMLQRVGKEDNHDLVTGVLIAAPIFILVGIFISFAFLVN